MICTAESLTRTTVEPIVKWTDMRKSEKQG